MVDYAVRAEGLAKSFKSTVAVDGVDLAVPRGAIYGLLGPNGAGKTTVVRLLTTLLRPDSGWATIDGVSVTDHPGEVRTRIGLTGQYAAVEERLTARENLELIGRLYHLDRRIIRRRSDDLLERFDLVEASTRVVKGYSGGMRRRLDIAMSLIARPSVLFLDEPTTGLDPRSRLAMWELIEELEGDGTTVLLTTQYLDESDRLADQIVVIDHGRIIAEGSTDELKDRIGGDHLAVTIASADNVERAIAALGSLTRGSIDVVDPGDFGHLDGAAVVKRPTSDVVSGEGERERGVRLRAAVRSGDRTVPRAIRALDDAGVDVLDVEVRRPTLDDVFLRLTGRRANDELAADQAGEK